MNHTTHHVTDNIHIRNLSVPPPPAAASQTTRAICPALCGTIDAEPSSIGNSSVDHHSPTHAARESTRKKRHDDEMLDETLEETFPASDPPSSGHIT